MSSTVLVLVDHVGRQYVGQMKDEVNDYITLIEPILMLEIVDRSSGRVNLNFEPVMHTFHIGEITIKWTSKFVANFDIADAYGKFMTQIKAKRARNKRV